MNWKKCKVNHKGNFHLSKVKTVCEIKDREKENLKEQLQGYIDELDQLQYRLFAEDRQSLLIILQGMDSAGKDGSIKHIMKGLNPQGVEVHSFKHPSTIELEHDYLWRYVQKLPERGEIAIFNRSHYENVLVTKVHPEILLSERLPDIDKVKKIDKAFWTRRYKQINDFEKNTIQNGTHILKFFLHLSKDEQRNRFIERLENKEKHWKFSSNDITERQFWSEYQSAYQLAIKHTSTKIAPWYVIPADDKLSAHILMSRIIVEKLKEMNPRFPAIDKKEQEFMKRAREKLAKEK